MNVQRKKKKMWSQDDEDFLVELWEEKLEDIRGPRKNNQIYMEMSEALQQRSAFFSPGEIKVKLHNMTNKYRRESRILGLSGSSPSEWHLYYKIHAFLGGLKISNPRLVVEDSIPQDDPLISADYLITNEPSQLSSISIKSELLSATDDSVNSKDQELTSETLEDHRTDNKLIKTEVDHTSCDEREMDTAIATPSSGTRQLPKNDEEMSSENVYALFSKIKNSTELSLGEFKRATDLFEDSVKVNRQRNDLMEMYLRNSLQIQTEMLTLIRKLNKRLK